MAVYQNISQDEKPRLVSRVEFGRTPWKSIAWRFGLALVFAALNLPVLYGFESKGELTRMDRRLFYILIILISALMSLTMGSLLGLLGAMLRWPLLAQRDYTPAEVDLIMGMAHPTGSVRLILHHTWTTRKWTTTTIVALIYLVWNIAARLSVAALGVTYDVNEVVSFPVLVTDWRSSEWFDLPSDWLDGMENDSLFTSLTVVSMQRYAALGRAMVRNESGVGWEEDQLRLQSKMNIAGLGLNRTVDGDKITYSYLLREYQGTETRQSEELLESSSTCLERVVRDGEVYERGEKIEIPDAMNQTTPDFLRVLDIFLNPDSEAEESATGMNGDPVWAAKMEWDKMSELSACATTYFFSPQVGGPTWPWPRNATFLDCRTCLAHNGGEGLGIGTLRNLPAENTSYVENFLLRQGAHSVIWDRFGEQLPAKSTLMIRRYPADNLEDFLDTLQTTFYDLQLGPGDQYGIDYKLGLQAAHVTAWLPLLSIIGAEMQLPKVTKEDGATDQPLLTFALQIQWSRAQGVLGGIMGFQLLAIALVVYSCRGVPLRDDSYLAIGRLLRTALDEIEGKSIATGQELAKWLNETKGLKLRYGTRSIEGEYEVDMVNVGGKFPDGLYR
ncbi:hypothetical protein B0I35DRAFT_79363 [Stachybotrys elegans]|uniref:Uncharacterized protein n=1 Tax=Stachybotrys elegans TaxID=80388 RepID=A0A8K0WN88_9HYPO|nr:hypothetical protein B0I35DRAFT_79363 [Stachybotrys elegans]